MKPYNEMTNSEVAAELQRLAPTMQLYPATMYSLAEAARRLLAMPERVDASVAPAWAVKAADDILARVDDGQIATRGQGSAALARIIASHAPKAAISQGGDETANATGPDRPSLASDKPPASNATAPGASLGHAESAGIEVLPSDKVTAQLIFVPGEVDQRRMARTASVISRHRRAAVKVERERAEHAEVKGAQDALAMNRENVALRKRAEAAESRVRELDSLLSEERHKNDRLSHIVNLQKGPTT